MATHKSAAKRHTQSLKRRDRNRTTKSAIKTNIKALMAVLEGASPDNSGDKKAIFTKVKAAIASAGSKGILHKKTAARKIGRLESRLNQI